MDKLPELADFLSRYGYIVIFAFVFAQELGIPNPVTNELVLLFSGYLCYTGTLNFYKVILISISADFIGTSILYFAFYSFSKWIISHSPKWIPFTGKTIERLKKHVLKRGLWSVYIGRLTPFLRGYVSVVAGMIHIERKKFLTTVIVSAITWSGGLVLVGMLLGPYWNKVLKNAGAVENIILIVVVSILFIVVGKYFTRRQLEEDK